jgi:hypothetical protein
MEMMQEALPQEAQKIDLLKSVISPQMTAKSQTKHLVYLMGVGVSSDKCINS